MFESAWDDSVTVEDVIVTVIEQIEVPCHENAPKLVYFLTLCPLPREYMDDEGTTEFA